MTEILEELWVIGDIVEVEDWVTYLLAILPDSFNMLVTALEANAEVPYWEIVHSFYYNVVFPLFFFSTRCPEKDCLLHIIAAGEDGWSGS